MTDRAAAVPGSAVSDEHARVTYDAFAPHYDEFTAHHDYEAWTRTLEGLARACGLRGRRLLDVACGTGKSFEEFLARGYEVTACDLSPGMLAVAASRAGERARLLEADMRELPVIGSFDLACVLDDAMNYLHTPEELRAALRGVARNLDGDGVLVFDTNTLYPYRTFFAEPLILHDGDRLLVWEGRASRLRARRRLRRGAAHVHS
jgi:SAM-dependent methyltransferase